MIYIDQNTYVIHPGELYKKELRDKAVEAERFDRDRFIVPESVLAKDFMETHRIATAYKVGFLHDYLRNLHPEWNFDHVYDHLFKKYQVFLSKRNVRQQLTYWRKYF